MSEFMPAKRLIYLETARGIASIIVVFHHFLLGFFPLLKGNVTQGGLEGTPLYLLVNGTGAVAFFFVLSGFVLTSKFYRSFSAPDLAASVLKRLPRLMLPAGLSTMIGAAILLYFPEAYAAAARLTGSAWLASFAFAGITAEFVPSFPDAARRSLLVFLLPGYAQYNSNLWTMAYEFYGSMLVFALVATCSLLLRRRPSGAILLHLAFAVLCVVLPLKLFQPFVIGSLLAFLHFRYPAWFRIPRWAVFMLALVMLAGYAVDNWYALTVASGAAMILLLGVPLLERRLGSPVGLFLGRLSFPLYLVHLLVLLSVTSAAYVALSGYGMPLWGVLVLCLALSLALSFLAALPFMALESLWVPLLNRWTQALVRRLMVLATTNSGRSIG